MVSSLPVLEVGDVLALVVGCSAVVALTVDSDIGLLDIKVQLVCSSLDMLTIDSMTVHIIFNSAYRYLKG